MICTRLFFKAITMMAIVILVMLVPTGSTLAQESTGDRVGPVQSGIPLQSSELNAIPDGPAYYSLSMFDFTPFTWSQGRFFDSAVLINPTQVQTILIAPLHLPQGAQINKVVMFYTDNADPYLDVELYLLVCPLAETSCPVGAYGESAHAYETPRVMEIVPYALMTIDNHVNSYLAMVTIDPAVGIGITGVRVDYGYPVSLPIIQR